MYIRTYSTSRQDKHPIDFWLMSGRIQIISVRLNPHWRVCRLYEEDAALSLLERKRENFCRLNTIAVDLSRGSNCVQIGAKRDEKWVSRQETPKTRSTFTFLPVFVMWMYMLETILNWITEGKKGRGKKGTTEVRLVCIFHLLLLLLSPLLPKQSQKEPATNRSTTNDWELSHQFLGNELSAGPFLPDVFFKETFSTWINGAVLSQWLLLSSHISMLYVRMHACMNVWMYVCRVIQFRVEVGGKWLSQGFNRVNREMSSISLYSPHHHHLHLFIAFLRTSLSLSSSPSAEMTK